MSNGIADSAVGAILEIPPQALADIKKAEAAIKSLQATSATAAQKIKGHFDNTAVSGLNAFIKKVEDAKNRLGNISMPTIDATGFASSISQIAQAMATVDRSATTGANRLTRIADAITKLSAAQPNPQLFQDIANGIAAIGNMSQQTITNVSQLAQMMAQLAKNIQTVQNAQRAMNNDTASAAAYNRLYKEQADLVRQKNELERKGTSITAEEQKRLDAIKNRYTEISAQLDALNKKKQTAATELARVTGGQRVDNTSTRTTVSGAINYAKQAKSLRELQDAYKNLKQVMQTVDPKSKDWQQMNVVLQQTKAKIDSIRKAMGEFQNQSRMTGDSLGKLKGQLAAAFSIGAIMGYIKKMVEVRGQFELQNVALRAILQNKDEADKIFMQVQNMALQSPFSIMQMTTFTKQLAAYRIESEKLVGTTKMLADVSAGLGVDMGRLILAYGQVKSANYLRACLGLGTPVMLYNCTFQKVEDIAVGDVLMGDDETPRHVSKLYQGEQQMYRVIYNGGEFRCNEHHILTVYDALTERIDDVFVFDYLKEPHRYQGIKRINGKYEVFPMKVVADNVDTYYGFSIDGNHRFIIQDNIVTHNTEIRQFTEAGLNIAGELATYFSELQDKMVSVGDVMEMVTKRMVRFEDVEEVFKRVTSAGGLFYDMQKKQSNTISGMLQRITDAWQIMLNDIGKSNQGIIRDALDLIRQMISHWRVLVPIIKTVGGAMALVFATKGIMAAVKGVRDMRAAIIHLVRAYGTLAMAQRAASIASWATGIGAAISILGLLAGAIAGAYMEANKLNEELERIGTESFDDMNTSIANYVKLADTIRSTNVSYTERQEAIEELNRTYKDILPTYLKEREYIDGNADSYATATKKIKEYYQAKEYQKKIEAVKTSGNFEEMIKELKGLGVRMVSYGWFDEEVPKAMVDSFMEQLANEFVSGETEATLDGVAKRIKEYFGNKLHDVGTIEKDWTGKVLKTGDLDAILNSSGWNNLTDAFEKWNKMESSIEEAKFSLTTAASMEEQYAAAAKMHAQEVIDGAQKQINEINAQIQAYFALKTELEKLKAKGQWSAEEKERMVALQGKIDQASASFFKMANSVIPGLDKAFLSNINNVFDLESALDTVSQKAFPTLAAQGVNALKPVKGEVTALTQAVNMLLTQLGIAGQLAGDKGPYTAKDAPMVLTPEEQQKWADKQNEIWRREQQTMQARVRERKKSNQEILQDEAKRYGIENALANKQILIQERTNKEYATDLRALAKEREGTLKDWDAGDSRARKLMGYTDAEIAQMRNEVKFLQSVAKEYDPYDDKANHKGTKGKDPILELWKNRKKAIEDYYTAREKARKNLSTDEAEAQLNKSFENLWKELKLDKVKGLSLNDLLMQGFDPKTLQGDLVSSLETLKKLIPAKYKDILKEVESTISKERVEIEFKVKEGERERLQRSITDIFDNYALTKELSKLGVSVDLTYMVGGKPTTLADIRAEYNRLMEGFADKSEEEQKIIKKMGEDLQKKEFDVRKQQLINYNKFLLESMAERIQIQMKAQREINRINDDETLDDTTRLMAIRRENEKLKKDLASQQWEDFQGSDLYIQLFENIEQASTRSIEYVLQKLKSLRASLTDLPPDQLRAVMKQIDKLEVQLNTRNPFAALKNNIGTAIKAFKELGAAERAFQEANDRYETRKKTRDDYAAWTTELEQQLGIERAKLGVDEFGQQIENDITRELEQQIKLRREQLGLMNENVDTLENEKNRLADVVSDFKKGKEAAGQALQQIGSWAQEAASTIGDVANSLENVFGTMSDGTRDTIESMQEVIGGVGDMTSGVGRFLEGDVIGGSLQAVKGLASTIGAIFAIGDKKKEREIKKLTEKVETLDKAYQKLEKSIESAYTFSDYNAGYKQMQQNLDKQKQAYEEMIRLEEAKKKSDDDKVKEYKDKLEEIAEAEKELYEKRHEKYGSTNDVWDEANNWADAWLDVYKETGDGLDALNDSWDEFYENLVKKQAASKVLGARMDGWIKQINDAIDKNMGSEYDYIDLFKQIGEKMKADFDATNADLKKIFEYAGIGGGAGSLILSDIQKGIQNITEPQAAAIEAYLNSMRFAVFRHTEQLDTLIATIQMQYGAGTENPVVTELKGIRGVLDNIYRDLHSVVKSGIGKTYIQVG